MKEDKNTNYPLIIVFYLDRGLMEETEIVEIFANNVSETITAKDANAMAFFLPTDGEERVECINPMQVEEAEMGRINTIVEDLIKNFDINPDIDENLESDEK